MIQINDLGARVRRKKDEIDRALQAVLESGWFVLGPEVKRFEELFASYISVNHCVTVANGTDALELAMKAGGVQANDFVGVAANAGMYSCTALNSINAKPIFLDVDLSSKSLSFDEVQRAIDMGVKAVIVTHLYGLINPEIEKIAHLCSKNSILLIEDCAQAHGAMLKQKRAGSFGNLAAFSFYPTKNLGALGDGGAVVTSDEVLAEKVKSLRQYGWSEKYRVKTPHGRNSRLDEMQATILSCFLLSLDDDNESRRRIASRYSHEITNPNILTPPPGGSEFVAHLYVIRTPDRDSLQEHLRTAGIATDVHYPVPDYRQPVFDAEYKLVTLENTEILSKEGLTIPCYPELMDNQIDHIIGSINSWIR